MESPSGIIFMLIAKDSHIEVNWGFGVTVWISNFGITIRLTMGLRTTYWALAKAGAQAVSIKNN
jgi:hypothetical protein